MRMIPVILLGCAGSAPLEPLVPATSFAEAPAPTPAPALAPQAPEPQRPGDPARGYDKLVQGDYVSCGIPWTAYARVFPPAPASLRLPGRTGHSALLRYDQTAVTTASGVEVVTANCLQCHAAVLQGELVLGLGNANADFTGDPSGMVRMAALLLTDEREKAELRRFVERIEAIAPYTRMATVGANPADNLAAALFAHRDPVTMAWSSEPRIPIPPGPVVPADVPAWWLMRHKSAMFHVAAGRGDHARTMMAASTLCTDDVDEARAIDAYMPDIRAWLLSLEPPPFPGPVDAALAAQGQAIYEGACARCHGGADGVYPDRWIALEQVGTDPLLAQGASQFGAPFLSWFHTSFYGEVSRLEPKPGYQAPPLDGVWATAPYFHNGSVPTLEAVLDPQARPAWFTRSYRHDDYDLDAVGWRYQALDHGQASEPDPELRRQIYDTTLPGYGSGGHPYADRLTAEERRAVLEHLKTL
jgi:cytochrome c5